MKAFLIIRKAFLLIPELIIIFGIKVAYIIYRTTKEVFL